MKGYGKVAKLGFQGHIRDPHYNVTYAYEAKTK